MLHSRPVHVIIVTSIPYMVSLFKVTFQDHSSFKSEILVQQICYIVLPCLPLIWFLGLLPPLEPLLFWSIEQIQIFAFGGSASASPGRSIFYIVSSLFAFILIFLASHDVFWTLIWSGILGYLLSLDWFGYLESLFRWIVIKLKKPDNEGAVQRQETDIKDESCRQDLELLTRC